jgi:hypothetical protein
MIQAVIPAGPEGPDPASSVTGTVLAFLDSGFACYARAPE